MMTAFSSALIIKESISYQFDLFEFIQAKISEKFYVPTAVKVRHLTKKKASIAFYYVPIYILILYHTTQILWNLPKDNAAKK